MKVHVQRTGEMADIGEADHPELATPNAYTVRRMPHGVVVFGPIPATELVALIPAWKELGYDMVDADLAKRLSASVVVTNQEESRAWREFLGMGGAS